jgi:hypothetical protein
MGASSAEIDQEIRETRGELEKKLDILERRAGSSARVYGRVAAGVAVGALAVVLGIVIYRRHRDGKLVNRLHDALVDMRDLPADVILRLKDQLPIKVVVTDKAHDQSAPNAWVTLAQKIAPALVGSAAGAVASRMRGTQSDTIASE